MQERALAADNRKGQYTAGGAFFSGTAVIFTVLVLWTLCLLGPALPVQASGAADQKISIDSVRLDGDEIEVTTKGMAYTDDAVFRLYAQEPYESGTQGEEVAQTTPLEGVSFEVPLNNNTKDSLLYKKFTLVIKVNGKLKQTGSTLYIENPEEIAEHTVERKEIGKKGILPAPELLASNSLADLGVDQIVYNVPLGTLMKNGDKAFTYDGKTYYVNSKILAQYDAIVPFMSIQGIRTTLILLNDLTSDETMIYPTARGYDGAYYYAFNAADKDGADTLAAITWFLADRYSDGVYGTVDNWIIGNEVNTREWYYDGSDSDVTTKIRRYADAFRICYNAIRSVNGKAKVYISLDHQYAENNASSGYFGSRTFLIGFAQQMKAQGDGHWGVAIHPYNSKMTSPYVWKKDAKVKKSQTSPYITMQNISILTDLMQRADMREPDGDVRSVLISEIGYTSTYGEAVQAAAIIYAYRQAENNPYIDGFLYSRQMDHATETAQGLASGLTTEGGTNKKSYSFYKNADSASIRKKAAAIIGVSDLDTFLKEGGSK